MRIRFSVLTEQLVTGIHWVIKPSKPLSSCALQTAISRPLKGPPAVEIIGHELSSYDEMIGQGIRALPKDVQSSDGVASIQLGYEGIVDQIRFLSPLKLSGDKTQKWVTGTEIFKYVEKFFRFSFKANDITPEISGTFQSLRLFEQPSRIFPVFVTGSDFCGQCD